MSMNFYVSIPTEFAIWIVLVIIGLCVRSHFEQDRIDIKLFGLTLKTWESKRFTTRPEKKLHRVFMVDANTGSLTAIPLLLNYVPSCLYEYKATK